MRVHLPVSPGRAHNLYLELVEAPPEGVDYVFPKPGETGWQPAKEEAAPALAKARSVPWLRRAYGPVHRHLLGGLGVKDRLDALRGKRSDYDLYHSLGSLHPKKEPWVVSPETALDAFGFGVDWHEEIRKPSSRAFARRLLLSPQCKRILPWNRPAMRSFERTFPEAWARLREKSEIVPLALRAGPEPPPETAAPPYRLLFVGSRNFPQDFVPKGGHIAMEAFRLLRARRDDVELVVRAKVPEPLRARHAGTPGLRIVDEFLSDADLQRLYHDAHVFVFPAAYTPGMVFPEAMRAGRPIVAFDVWANADVVEHGATGLLVAPPEGIAYVNEFGYPTWNNTEAFTGPFQANAGPAAQRIADAVASLLDDKATRVAMGRKARQEVAGGRLSIARRNAALKRNYEMALRA